MESSHATKDSALIEVLGGPARVAQMLRDRGVESATTQRVSNWKARGIPAQMKVSFPDLFMPELNSRKATRKKAA